MAHQVEDPPLFKEERLVIVTSTDAINMIDWRAYLDQNFDRLARQDSKILILGGIHGRKNGEIGRRDENWVRWNKLQIGWLERKRAKEISERNIKIEHVDLGACLVDDKLDEGLLKAAIQDPTLVFLAFCFTDVSVLNDILRGAGIYAAMIVKQETNMVTEGHYARLDPVQEMVVREVGDRKVSNVFIWGSGGSGKTIVATQVLDIILAQYRAINKQYKAIVTSYYSYTTELLSDMRQRYLPHLVTDNRVEFTTISKLRSKLGIQCDYKHPTTLVQTIIDTLGSYQDNYILLVDEIPASDYDTTTSECNWSSLYSPTNVRYILAISPDSATPSLHFVTPPTSSDTIAKRLPTPHRNSASIQQYLRYRIQHHGQDYLSPTDDHVLPDDVLPPGPLPLWLERTEEVEDREVLARVKQDIMEEGKKVVLLYDRDDGVSDDVTQFCRQCSWQCYEWRDYIGCEADTVIIMGEAVGYREAVSRARNKLILISTRGR